MEISGKEAISLVEHWEYLAGMTMGQPNKTGRFSLIPDVKFFVAESLKEPIGIMLAIALSHHEKGDKCIRPAAEINHIKAFLGDDFAEIAGKRRFMTRRANKAYIQGIEATAEVEPGSAKGYMLAALARSHKGGIGELADMTEVYLRECGVSQASKPDFILREMFERGIFGFIPALLLNEYCHEDYRKLGVSGQTKIIKMIGLSPMQLESIVSSIDRSMDRAEKAVGEILSMVDNSKEAVHKVLQNLCAGEIPAKQEECFACGLLPDCHAVIRTEVAAWAVVLKYTPRPHFISSCRSMCFCRRKRHDGWNGESKALKDHVRRNPSGGISDTCKHGDALSEGGNGKHAQNYGKGD
jgi:hypothetical protein